MQYLKIKNQGELDVRLISLMGGSTKQNDSIKIGKFGTGLKYSLAWLIRNNIDFKIFIGTVPVEIKVVTEKIQNTDFEILYINGERSSITSTMGMDWEAWMICREIWCNALDAGSAERSVTDQVAGTEGCTTFYIQNAADIKAVVDNWANYFIDAAPIFENALFAVYPAKERLCIYKQGVLIHREKDLKGVFAYDFKKASINELREYKGHLTYDICQLLQQIDVAAVRLFLSGISDLTFESEMDYDWGGVFGDAWSQAIGQAKIISQKDFDAFKEKGIEIDEASMIILPKSLFQKLAGNHPHVSAVQRADKVNSFFEVECADTRHKINIGLEMLEDCGYRMNPELKWITGVFGNREVMARVNITDKLVMFSQELSRKSQFDIITAIIEENEHFVTGFQDCSRSFQQHFIDLYTKQLMEKKGIAV